jgi:hypothetical protein
VLARLADGELLVLAALVAAVVTPPSIANRGPRLCLISRVIGRPCPACGLTRSWVAIAHGDLSRATAWNRLGPATFAYAATYAVLRSGHRERRQRV